MSTSVVSKQSSFHLKTLNHRCLDLLHKISVSRDWWHQFCVGSSVSLTACKVLLSGQSLLTLFLQSVQSCRFTFIIYIFHSFCHTEDIQNINWVNSNFHHTHANKPVNLFSSADTGKNWPINEADFWQPWLLHWLKPLFLNNIQQNETALEI